MIVVTKENLPGHPVGDVKGRCFGVVVRSRRIGVNLMARPRSIVRGEIHGTAAVVEPVQG